MAKMHEMSSDSDSESDAVPINKKPKPVRSSPSKQDKSRKTLSSKRKRPPGETSGNTMGNKITRYFSATPKDFDKIDDGGFSQQISTRDSKRTQRIVNSEGTAEKPTRTTATEFSQVESKDSHGAACVHDGVQNDGSIGDGHTSRNTVKTSCGEEDEHAASVSTQKHKLKTDDSYASSTDTEPYNFDAEPEADYDSDSGEWKGMKAKKNSMQGERTKKPLMWTRWNDADMMEYRKGYPNKRDNPRLKQNLLFYTNQIPSAPRGALIDEIHKKWYGNYDLLETHHGYIQWLFPIRESGMNFQAQELQLHEAKAIQNDKKARERVLKSYEMMLNFYGIRLMDKHRGRLERAKNWRIRFTHLNRSYHNYLRITRILKSLGELGFEYLKVPFLEFILQEAYVEKTLTNCGASCRSYWVETVRDDHQRRALVKFADDHAEEWGRGSAKV